MKKLLAIAVCVIAPIGACKPPPLYDVDVAHVELLDLALLTSTVIVEGNFGTATLAITDEHGKEHEVPVQVKGDGAGLGAEIIVGLAPLHAQIDMTHASVP